MRKKLASNKSFFVFPTVFEKCKEIFSPPKILIKPLLSLFHTIENFGAIEENQLHFRVSVMKNRGAQNYELKAFQ